MVEKSELNDSAALKQSTSNLEGASGDGNDPSQADLQKGFSKVPDPDIAPHYLPQNDDGGTNYVGDRHERGGFLNRPAGWER